MRQQTRITNVRAKLQGRRNARKFITIKYCIPEWALTTLFYGDSSGLEDEDEAAIMAFLESEKLSEESGHWSYDSEQEAYLCHRNDITSLGDNCVDIKWIQWID